MPEAHLEPVVDHDAAAGFAVVRGVHETNHDRDLHLLLEPDGNRFHLTVQTADPELAAAFGDDLEHDLPISAAELWGLVQACRQAWRTHLVDLEHGGALPFQDQWDFAARPELAAAAVPKLAEAGSKLFLALFYPRPPGNPERYEGLRRIGRVLRRQMSARSRWLRVTSDSFFAPWSLIYSDNPGPDGANWRREGFWGFQHLIEHAPPGAGGLGNELAAPAGRPLEVGLQLDRTIDDVLGVPCLAPVLELFESYPEASLVRRLRGTRAELAAALRDGPASEQVLFFCCHAEQEGDLTGFRVDESYLALTDRPVEAARITPGDLTLWMDMREFAHRPLVLLNACGSGQLNSIFYAGFGRTLLGLGASSVIGAQTELPAVFAGEFARRFFSAFFAGGKANKVGEVLFRVRREMLERHHNPLGLIYSLYRGADNFLPRALPRD